MIKGLGNKRADIIFSPVRQPPCGFFIGQGEVFRLQPLEKLRNIYGGPVRGEILPVENGIDFPAHVRGEPFDFLRSVQNGRSEEWTAVIHQLVVLRRVIGVIGKAE